MFPSFRQRVMVVGGVAGAGWLYASVAEFGRAADGREGLSLVLAASPAVAAGIFAGVTIAATLIAGFVGAWGNPLAGVFTLGASLACAAVAAGNIEPWLRSHGSPAGYVRLAVDILMWAAILLIAVEACIGIGEKLGRVMPALPRDEPQKAQRAIESLLAKRGGWWASVGKESPKLHHLAATAVAVAVGAVGSILLVRSSDVWQVVWGLGFAFLLGTMTAHQLFPKTAMLGPLMSPLLAGGLSYLLIAAAGSGHEKILAWHYADRLWGPVLALPVYYASAGLAGAAAGLGASQVLWAGKIEGGSAEDQTAHGPEPQRP